jgi:hypothetical protein
MSAPKTEVPSASLPEPSSPATALPQPDGPEEKDKDVAKPALSVDDLTVGAKPGRETKGRAQQWEKSGGADQANKDFDSLRPGDVRPIQGGRVGQLPDGRMVNVRTGSSDGRPTLEVQSGKNSIKIRYDP